MYSIRPGRLRDLPAALQIFDSTLGRHPFFRGVIYPADADPQSIAEATRRRFLIRFFDPAFRFDVAVPDPSSSSSDPSNAHPADVPVGFTWWKEPDAHRSFYDKWLSPFAWISPLIRALLTLHNRLRPLSGLGGPDPTAAFNHMLTHDLEPRLFTDEHPRRRTAYYLSTLVVQPGMQGTGVGSLLIKYGLALADKAYAAAHPTKPAAVDETTPLTSAEKQATAWLIAVEDVEPFYQRNGFVIVDRANRGALSNWRGGAVMFRGPGEVAQQVEGWQQ